MDNKQSQLKKTFLIRVDEDSTSYNIDVLAIRLSQQDLDDLYKLTVLRDSIWGTIGGARSDRAPGGLEMSWWETGVDMAWYSYSYGEFSTQMVALGTDEQTLLDGVMLLAEDCEDYVVVEAPTVGGEMAIPGLTLVQLGDATLRCMLHLTPQGVRWSVNPPEGELTPLDELATTTVIDIRRFVSDTVDAGEYVISERPMVP